MKVHDQTEAEDRATLGSDPSAALVAERIRMMGAEQSVPTSSGGGEGGKPRGLRGQRPRAQSART